MSSNEETHDPQEILMILGENDGISSAVKRVDEDLPWALDPNRLENWSDQEMYDLEVSFREWLLKSMKNASWRAPRGKGKWNQGNRMTFDLIRAQFNIPPNGKDMVRLQKLCKYYANRVRHSKYPIEVKGKKCSPTGYYLPREPKQMKMPYNLRLRFEIMMAEGKEVRDMRSLRLPDSDKKTVWEMDATRRLQNAKRKEYYQRWKERYGEEYIQRGTDRLSNEDSISRDRLDS